MDVDIFDELRGYAEEFDQEALEMFDYCYRQDDVLAQQLLTCELTNWSRQTCLRLAVACNHRMLLAHPCSQQILGDLWMGGLRTRRNTYIKGCAHYEPSNHLDPFKSSIRQEISCQIPKNPQTLLKILNSFKVLVVWQQLEDVLSELEKPTRALEILSTCTNP